MVRRKLALLSALAAVDSHQMASYSSVRRVAGCQNRQLFELRFQMGWCCSAVRLQLQKDLLQALLQSHWSQMLAVKVHQILQQQAVVVLRTEMASLLLLRALQNHLLPVGHLQKDWVSSQAPKVHQILCQAPH